VFRAHRILLGMSKLIMVITHTQERNEYNSNGRLISEKGSIWVAHGVDVDTGKNIILPTEKWENFRHNCFYDNNSGEWFLK
jgi:hypothetical protein